MGSLKHPASFQPAVNPQLPEIDEWEIPPTEVIMEDCLGEGAFGEVYKGVVKGPIKCNRVMPSLRNAIAVPVAVKVLKGEQNDHYALITFVNGSLALILMFTSINFRT